MKFYILFIVAGVGLFGGERMLLWLKRSDFFSCFFSGAVVGLLLGWIIKWIYQMDNLGWVVAPLVTISGSILLLLFARFKLYQLPALQLFSTILLGIFTGLLSWLLLKILMIIFPQLPWLFYRPQRLWLDLILLGFLLHFGYIFSVRITKRLIRADQSKA